MSPRDSGEFTSGPPRRLLDDPEGATDLERAVLQSGVEMHPPPGSDRAIFAALVAKLGPTAGGGGGAPPNPGPSAPPATPAAGGAAAKGAATAVSAASGGGGLVASSLIGAACALAVLGGATLLEDRGRPAPPPSPVAVVAPSTTLAPPAPRAAAPAADPLAIDAPSARLEASAAPSTKPSESAAAKLAELAPPPPNEPAPAPGVPAIGASNADPGGAPGAGMGAGDPAAIAERASRLREESQILSQARDALHAGDVATCFALLETARTRFSGGVLGQEREALTIEALARSGNRALAAQRAAAFLAAYPTSPHAARVRTFAQ